MIWDFVELDDIYIFSTVSKKVDFLTHELLREHCRLAFKSATYHFQATLCKSKLRIRQCGDDVQMPGSMERISRNHAGHFS